MNRKLFFLATIAFFNIFHPVYSDTNHDDEIALVEIPEDFAISRIQMSQNESETFALQDAYLQAYIQGSLDSRYPDAHVKVRVENGTVKLSGLPQDNKKAHEITDYARSFCAGSSMVPENTDIIAQEAQAPTKEIRTAKYEERPSNGVWFPQSTVLFPTEIANPHQVMFSGGIRFRDEITGQTSTPVVFGDQFPIYRWSNIWKWHGDLQVEAEGAVFAVFNQDYESSPLVNADYYIGIPLTYAVGKWAHRLRLYHISSHLGDEEIIRVRPELRHERKNKSFEALDLFTDYQFTKNLRFYGGVGAVVHSDSEMHMKPLYVEYGMEARIWRHDFEQLFGQPFIAFHVENWQDNDYKFDFTAALGYEWGKIFGLGRKMRVWVAYHDGFSQEGQFSRKRADYLEFRLGWGF